LKKSLILIFFFVSLFGSCQEEQKLPLEYALSPNDSVLIVIKINKLIDCTQEKFETINLRKSNNSFYGKYINSSSSVYSLNNVSIDFVKELISLEKYCLKNNISCSGGFSTKTSVKIVITVNDKSSSFIYCLEDIDGIDTIIKKHLLN
jgi:hypothetical protein